MFKTTTNTDKYINIVKRFTKDARTTNSIKYANLIHSFCTSGNKEMLEAVRLNLEPIESALLHARNMYKRKGDIKKLEQFNEAIVALYQACLSDNEYDSKIIENFDNKIFDNKDAYCKSDYSKEDIMNNKNADNTRDLNRHERDITTEEE